MLIGLKSGGNAADSEYREFLTRLQERVDSLSSEKFFTTDSGDLWKSWISSFPQSARQYNSCSACRKFIQKYGSLVIINEEGETAPVIWDASIFPEEERGAALALEMIVSTSKVTGVFYAKEEQWGDPGCDTWSHMCVKGPKFNGGLYGMTLAHEAMAEKKEEYAIVRRALAEFDEEAADKAYILLSSGAFLRSEKAVKQADWFRMLYGANENQIWRAVASAPAGFCHPRSSMLGTLIEDIQKGLSNEDIKRKFGAKMSPLQYQRPKAAPKSGQIDRAEKLVDLMGVRKSFERRFALKSELRNLWDAEVEGESPKKEMFGHLREKKGGNDSPVSVGKVSWSYFKNDVLPSASKIKLFLPNSRMTWGAICTAVHEDAPPIFQWDDVDQRNPFSWYVWCGGSFPENVGLQMGWYDLFSICKKPCNWDRMHEQHGDGYFLIVDKAREKKMAGNALFPECLRAELREIRGVVEAYSRTAEIDGQETDHACGVLLGPHDIGQRLRARQDGQWFEYQIASFR